MKALKLPTHAIVELQEHCRKNLSGLGGLPGAFLHRIAEYSSIEVLINDANADVIQQSVDFYIGHNISGAWQAIAERVIRVSSTLNRPSLLVADAWLKPSDVVSEENHHLVLVDDIPHYTFQELGEVEQVLQHFYLPSSMFFVAAVFSDTDNNKPIKQQLERGAVEYYVPIFDNETFAIVR